jgi:pyridoxal phosphate enzyme (YggS family)
VLRPLLQNNLRTVRDRIERAARRAGRDPAAVRLVAVTKSVPTAVALELAALGERELGENRVDGLERKAAGFAAGGQEAHWHFIGHLQGNKARRVVRLAQAIHSVDSLALIERLERLAGEEGRRPRVFLEVKLSAEDAKQGFEPDALPEAARRAADATHLRFSGLMTMAPLGDPADGAKLERARAVFDRLVRLGGALEAELGHRIEGGELRYSMGMSDDFEQAVEAGSHYVRVGSALFEGLRAEPEVRA